MWRCINMICMGNMKCAGQCEVFQHLGTPATNQIIIQRPWQFVQIIPYLGALGWVIDVHFSTWQWLSWYSGTLLRAHFRVSAQSMSCGKMNIYHPSRSPSVRYYLHEVLSTQWKTILITRLKVCTFLHVRMIEFFFNRWFT